MLNQNDMTSIQTLITKNSFLPNAIQTWNNAVEIFPDTHSITIFKKRILSLIRPERRSIFNIHDPLGLRYLFYLRVGLSSLRSHKNRHGFLDSPSGICVCNLGIEDTNRYLFSCYF